MTYELIGKPQIETEYSDEYETTMVASLKREDGVTGDAWISAGVPDHMRGSSDAARTQSGYQSVRVWGSSSPDEWCPRQFRPAEEMEYQQRHDYYRELAEAVVAACETAALEVHDARYREMCAEKF